MDPLIQRTADKRRRWFGLLYLLIAALMLLWGTTLLETQLKGWGFILYWLGCLLMTLLAAVTALLDIWIIRIRARQQRRKMLSNALRPDDPSSKTPPGETP